MWSQGFLGENVNMLSHLLEQVREWCGAWELMRRWRGADEAAVGMREAWGVVWDFAVAHGVMRGHMTKA